MTRIVVQAGQSMLEGLVRTPATGICELIWNAFDEDATSVEVTVEVGALDGLDQIIVEDDGNGMTLERAESGFARVGDSWKLMPGTRSEGGRPVHGRHGRGRYAAFALGSGVRWTSTAKSVEGELATVQISGARGDLQHFDVTEISPEPSTGTVVRVRYITPETIQQFDRRQELSNRLLMEFALHLERFKDFTISFLGDQVDPSKAIANKIDLPLALPEGAEGSAVLTVIEWTLADVERRLYLCSAEGSIVDELPAGIQAVGAEFTAYLRWDGFSAGEPLALDADTATPAGKVIEAAREALREYLRESVRRREALTVKRWKNEGVYPYKGEPANEVERATRDTFNLVAMAASRTVDEAKGRGPKALALSLMRETFESDPESLLPILRQVTNLPTSRIEELRDILEHTTLAQLIQTGRAVGNRVEFISGLDAILFDRQTKKRLLERRQLHRILAHETWIFGENWSLMGDDQRLTEVLKKFLGKLQPGAELANLKPVLRDDGSDAIPDLVLGRSLETNQDNVAHLVVELKRPRHRLKDEDVSQLRSYASAIVNDDRFSQPNVAWSFWLVGNETDQAVDDMRRQDHLPFGVVQSGRYTITVKTWAEIINEAKHRLKFVQRALQYESTRDSGLDYMRKCYGQYLPTDEPVSE